ncbi:DUF771 domain-containing protein [Staphylococcus aureus]|nr:DUF771 domain-containing protein [Staphylococcus aureus]UVI86674.1 DUF771 domain-containing protein [Staphylococcus aureus]UVJ27829.1 DUF771 domain-containing protein [Staphylococcus aureus]
MNILIKSVNAESISIEIPIQTILNAIYSNRQDNQLKQLQLVILTKEQYDKSQDNQKNVQMTMLELQEEMQRDRSWIIKHLLQDDYFRRKIARFSQFPINDSGKYLFHRKRMLRFLDDYAEEIVERSNNTIRIEKNKTDIMKPKKRGRA